MITAKADKVTLEDVGHRLWVVSANDGPVSYKRKVYKSYKAALDHATKLMNYYQVANLTEVYR